MSQRVVGALAAATGCLMALLAFLPWFDFRSFSVSGIDLPGQEGEAFLLLGLLIVGAGGAVTGRRFGQSPLLALGFLGIVAFAIATRPIFTYWRAGTCSAFTGAAPTDDYICRGYSDMALQVDGSPTVALWAGAGLSAFVSLLAGWRLFTRPAQSEPEAPTETSEAWA